jgi:hypothetical protein
MGLSAQPLGGEQALGVHDHLDELGPAAHAQFGVDIPDMVLDGEDGDKELLFDLAVAFSLQNQLDDLPFPGCDLFIVVDSVETCVIAEKSRAERVVFQEADFEPDHGEKEKPCLKNEIKVIAGYEGHHQVYDQEQAPCHIAPTEQPDNLPVVLVRRDFFIQDQE